MIIKLLAFVLPLTVDSFAVAAALASSRALARHERFRVALLFTVFEGGMPLIGLALGAGLAHAIGPVAGYLAAVAVIGIGGWMLLADDDDDEPAGRLLASPGIAVIGLGLGISMDELAIGFSLGLSQLPLVPVIVAIAIQSFIAAWLGLAIGARLSERLRERADQLAAIALIALGIALLVEQVTA